VPTQSFSFRLLVCLTKDGHWLQFSQTSPHLFREFMEVLGLSWMFDDPEWSTAPEFDTEEKRERFWEKLLEAARRKTLAEWQAIFAERTNVWAEPFRTTREVLHHPQLRHNRQVLEVPDPRAGRVRMLAPMVRMDETPGAVRWLAPELGEHTAEVLSRISESEPARRTARVAVPRQPLEGVTILDLGVFYAAPYGPAILADYGARVIKVEPLSGEPMRRMLPFPDAGAVKSLQGKESVAVDIARPEGREILHRLVREVDLVMVSYRAGVARKHGLDYDTLRAINPRLVYLNAPGYGIDGPCGRKPAYAPTIGAAVGAARLQAGPSVQARADLSLEEIKSASIRLGHAASAPGQADGCGALGVATALLLGLVARERTGLGQEMLTSMLATAAFCVSEDAIEYDTRAERRQPDALLLGLSALYRLYEASEGWIFLAAPKPREWGALCAALSPHASLASDSRFATLDARKGHDAELAATLAAVFRRRPAAEWERDLTDVDVGCVEVAPGPVARAVMDDPIGREAGFLCEVEHPSFGRHRRLAPLAELSLTPGEGKPACLFGQQTEAVLRELGYGAAEIERLEAGGVIARS
ncbi:MAG: CoA transferase, partial [Candidatus Binatia bacterium]